MTSSSISGGVKRRWDWYEYTTSEIVSRKESFYKYRSPQLQRFISCCLFLGYTNKQISNEWIEILQYQKPRFVDCLYDPLEPFSILRWNFHL
jgi:hypothetical protein